VHIASVDNGKRVGEPTGTVTPKGGPNPAFGFMADGRCGRGDAWVDLHWDFVPPDTVIITDPNSSDLSPELVREFRTTLKIRDGELWEEIDPSDFRGPKSFSWLIYGPTR